MLCLTTSKETSSTLGRAILSSIITNFPTMYYGIVAKLVSNPSRCNTHLVVSTFDNYNSWLLLRSYYPGETLLIVCRKIYPYPIHGGASPVQGKRGSQIVRSPRSIPGKLVVVYILLRPRSQPHQQCFSFRKTSS